METANELHGHPLGQMAVGSLSTNQSRYSQIQNKYTYTVPPRYIFLQWASLGAVFSLAKLNTLVFFGGKEDDPVISTPGPILCLNRRPHLFTESLKSAVSIVPQYGRLIKGP